MTNLRFALIGNSGSGKTTYARHLAEQYLAEHQELAVLDLDQVAWEPDAPTTLRPSEEAAAEVRAFCAQNDHWIVEGCYADLVHAALEFGPELIFLDPGEAQCVANCRNRPWEPTKYASKAEQDKNLEFLLGWVADYYHRDGHLSHKEHLALFNDYPGPKQRLTALPTNG